MRKIFVLVLVCIMLLCTACDNKVTQEKLDDDTKYSMFVLIEYTQNYRIVYHRDTKVMYAVSDGSYNHGTFTLLVNPDGTPMLYKGDK